MEIVHEAASSNKCLVHRQLIVDLESHLHNNNNDNHGIEWAACHIAGLRWERNGKKGPG